MDTKCWQVDTSRLQYAIMKYQGAGKRNPGHLLDRLLDCYIWDANGREAYVPDSMMMMMMMMMNQHCSELPIRGFRDTLPFKIMIQNQLFLPLVFLLRKLCYVDRLMHGTEVGNCQFCLIKSQLWPWEVEPVTVHRTQIATRSCA
jgi:hypothetical protein